MIKPCGGRVVDSIAARFVFESTPRLEVVGVEDFVCAVVRHDLVDVVLRLVEADLGCEDAGVFVYCARDPARDVVLAAVVRGGDGFGQVREHLVQLRQVRSPDEDVDFGSVEVVKLSNVSEDDLYRLEINILVGTAYKSGNILFNSDRYAVPTRMLISGR